MGIKSFEELIIWQDSIKLCELIYQATTVGTFYKDKGLQNQLQRAIVSVSSNIAEGFERSNNKEFVTFLRYAKGSLGEVRTQVHIATNLGYITPKQDEQILSEAIKLSKQISTFITYLKSK